MKGKSSYLLNESLNDFVLIRHVRDHVRHVVFRGSDKSWAKHNGQVTWLHLVKHKQSFHYWLSTCFFPIYVSTQTDVT